MTISILALTNINIFITFTTTSATYSITRMNTRLYSTNYFFSVPWQTIPTLCALITTDTPTVRKIITSIKFFFTKHTHF